MQRVANVGSVVIGDLVHLFYAGDLNRGQDFGVFRVIDPKEHSQPALFAAPVPKSALYTIAGGTLHDRLSEAQYEPVWHWPQVTGSCAPGSSARAPDVSPRPISVRERAASAARRTPGPTSERPRQHAVRRPQSLLSRRVALSLRVGALVLALVTSSAKGRAAHSRSRGGRGFAQAGADTTGRSSTRPASLGGGLYRSPRASTTRLPSRCTAARHRC